MAKSSEKLTDQQLVSVTKWLRSNTHSMDQASREAATLLLPEFEARLANTDVSREAERSLATVAAKQTQLIDVVLEQFPSMATRGLTRSSLTFIEQVEAQLREADKKVDGLLDAADAKEPCPAYAKIHLDVLNPLIASLKKCADVYASSKDAPLLSSTRWTKAARRQTLAADCQASGLVVGREAASWATDGLGMIAMSFGDQASHFHLAEALLDGDPKKIREASYMDTNCRERISNAAWNFVLEASTKIEPVPNPENEPVAPPAPRKRTPR
jgi:hypothetical protein